MKEKRRIYVEPGCTLARLACAFMACSMVLRLVWCARFPGELSGSAVFTQGVLPLLSAAVFIFCLLRYGKKALWISFFPVLGGVIFFLTKAAGFVWWHRALCTLLYLSVAALYGLTVFGVLPTRRLLVPLFGIPLAYHLVVQDLIQNLSVYSAAQWLKECSVLCIMAALLTASIAMREEEPGVGR